MKFSKCFKSSETMASLQSEEKKNTEKLPTVCIIIGMAGSGKTTLMQRINAHVHQFKKPSYIINLDPAVYEIPYEANIDIRDTINYKEVMKQYSLGPNGGILTSLNLFSTKFEQVIDLIDKRKNELEYVFIDTPGQIEVFTWSASGQIITETLAATYPTMLIYVIDTLRCMDPVTFMSNMTYSCSILYKTKLPFLFRKNVIAFNKIDVQSHLFAIDWMQSLDDFEEALSENKTYQSTLIKALGGVLDAFYKNIKTVGVSAVSGQGMLQCFEQIELCKREYFEEYKPMIIKKMNERKQREQMEKEKKRKQIEKKAKNDGLKSVYKQESKEEHLEKMMNLGLNDGDNQSDDDNEQQQQELADDQDEILKFLQT